MFFLFVGMLRSVDAGVPLRLLLLCGVERHGRRWCAGRGGVGLALLLRPLTREHLAANRGARTRGRARAGRGGPVAGGLGALRLALLLRLFNDLMMRTLGLR